MQTKLVLKTKNFTDKNGYNYQQVEGDETGVRIYKLNNGLTVYLAQNDDAPRIQTYIPVRTGSNNDPSDNTGLAHYLEHMMFKGTSKLGTLDWEKEKVLLDQISDLYELHNPSKIQKKRRKFIEKSTKFLKKPVNMRLPMNMTKLFLLWAQQEPMRTLG